MRDKALGFIRERGLLFAGDRVIVALSGGADSVSLLHFLNSIKEKYNLSLYALHLNHMIRGDEADRDERFVRDLCARWGIELFVEHADIPALATHRHIGLELCARQERYRLFDRYAERLGAKIATAHTLSDNAETVLLNLTRGSGVRGMCGIPARRGAVIRPLLMCSRADIEAYCAAHELDYVTDSTNLAEDCSRNTVRLSVMPTLRTLNPSVEDSIARLCAVMNDVDDFLEEYSEKELKSCATAYGYACERLLALPRAPRRTALYVALAQAGASCDSLHYPLIEDAMRTGGSVDLPEGYRVVCAQGILRVSSGEEAEDFEIPLSDYDGAREYSSEELKKVHKKFLDDCIRCDIITQNTVVRRRRAGDRIALPRRGVTKSLRKYLSEQRVPRERRDSLTVVADGSDVLWVEGVGASQGARVPDDRSTPAIHITPKK